MAESTFNLGIENKGVYGSLQLAEDFLNDEATATTDPNDLKPNDPEEPKKATKIIPKKVEPPIEEEKVPEVKVDPLEDIEDEDPAASEDNSAEPLSIFENLSKELYKANVFTVGDDGKEVIAKSPEEFLNLFNQEKEKGAEQWLENFLSQYGQDRMDMFQAIYVNGVDPKEYLPVYNNIQSLENVNLEDEASQEKVLRTYYERLGWDTNKIDQKVEKLKSYSDLEDEAKTVHPLLIKQDKDNLAQITFKEEQRQQAINQADVEYKTSLEKVLNDSIKSKELAGIPVNPKKAEAAFNFMYKKNWKTADGNTLTDFDKFILDSKKPENIAIRTKIALLALDGFDFTKIEKKAISTESNELFSSLAQKQAKKSNTQPASQNIASAW